MMWFGPQDHDVTYCGSFNLSMSSWCHAIANKDGICCGTNIILV